MPRFSVRQILIGFVALGVGLAIWRLPQGSWFDVPLALVSFYFLLSLRREAADMRRMLAYHPQLETAQRWGVRILVCELMGIAVILVAAWVLAFLVAVEALDMGSYLGGGVAFYPIEPRDLAALAMLAAIGVGSWRTRPAPAVSVKQTIWAALAAAVVLGGIIFYWFRQMMLWYLVYVALDGMEAAQSPRFMPAELQVGPVARIRRFALGAEMGLLLVVANALLVFGGVLAWKRPRVRVVFVTLVTLGMSALCWCVYWLGGRGLWQLSPALQEALTIPPLPPLLVGAAMVVLSVGVFTWRALVLAKPFSEQATGAAGRYFHESWLGSLLVGMVAALSYLFVASELPPSLEWLLDGMLSANPTRFIWLAAVIGGFGMAWRRWRGRKQPTEPALPSIDPLQFVVVATALLILLIATAPVIAAVSFSCWLKL